MLVICFCNIHMYIGRPIAFCWEKLNYGTHSSTPPPKKTRKWFIDMVLQKCIFLNVCCATYNRVELFMHNFEIFKQLRSITEQMPALVSKLLQQNTYLGSITSHDLPITPKAETIPLDHTAGAFLCRGWAKHFCILRWKIGELGTEKIVKVLLSFVNFFVPFEQKSDLMPSIWVICFTEKTL
jgi:hypothetical protein